MEFADKTTTALEEFLLFLRREIGARPEKLDEAASLLNEYLFHAFSDVRNAAMCKVRVRLDPGQTLLTTRKEAAQQVQLPA